MRICTSQNTDMKIWIWWSHARIEREIDSFLFSFEGILIKDPCENHLGVYWSPHNCNIFLIWQQVLVTRDVLKWFRNGTIILVKVIPSVMKQLKAVAKTAQKRILRLQRDSKPRTFFLGFLWNCFVCFITASDHFHLYFFIRSTYAPGYSV